MLVSGQNAALAACVSLLSKLGIKLVELRIIHVAIIHMKKPLMGFLCDSLRSGFGRASSKIGDLWKVFVILEKMIEFRPYGIRKVGFLVSVVLKILHCRIDCIPFII